MLMDFDAAIQSINELLSTEHPETFSSSWISKRSPRCYRFIWKNVRTDSGDIDWDRITRALEWKFQRSWLPRRSVQSGVPYRNSKEMKAILEKYRTKLYVFVSPQDRSDRHTRDIISIALVRLAQRGNETARQELIKLLAFTIDDWIDHYWFLSRWRGHEAEIRTQVERCIRRYRYSGSFLRYLFRTLQYAGRGIRPLVAYSLDEPAFDGSVNRIDAIGRNATRSNTY
jgi:hypothetical protein